MITVLWEGIGGWHWSVDADDATYSGLRATEAEAQAEMDGVVRGLISDIRAQEAAKVDALRARAEAAEAEVARLRADARLLVGMVNHACLWDLTQEDYDALEPLVRAADGLLDDEAAGVIRRALGGAR